MKTIRQVLKEVNTIKLLLDLHNQDQETLAQKNINSSNEK